MAKPITYPTEGGSYVRKPGGGLDQVEATKPAPDPATSNDQPAAAPAAPTSEKE